MANLTYDLIAHDRASRVMKDVGDHTSRLKGHLATLGLVAGGAALGGVAVLGSALVQGVKDAASFQALAEKSTAVLKSTGNAANTSVAGIQDLASALESMSGVDEELIINSQNVLATFTNISNKGPDRVFDDAAKAALNMSTALGTDLQGATIQVGKALNDPIKGVTALSKVGVSFTQQQRDQIKAMTESGDTMGAQKLILGELSKEFGGAAEAAGKGFNGSMARLKDSVGDAFRQIGTALLPALTRLADWLAGKMPAAIKAAGTAWNFLREAGARVWSGLQTLWGGVRAGMKALDPGLSLAVANVRAGLALFKGQGDSAHSMLKVIKPTLEVVGRIIGVVVVGAVLAVTTYFRAWATVMTSVVIPAVKGVLSFFLTMVSGILTGIQKVFEIASHAPGKMGEPFRKALPAIREAKASVDGVRASLDQVKSKTVTLRINTIAAVYGSKGGHYVGSTFVPYGAADGAVVRPVAGGTVVRVAEAGQPEAIVPLSKAKTFGFGPGDSAGGRGDVTVIINAPLLDSPGLMRMLKTAAREVAAMGAGGGGTLQFGAP